ncbi:MAG: hypothetical protein GEU75_04900 [Dehalococcoidia bacterium]|nr:hypothetical protein [Dehalococcoidia bacterium]
MDFVMLLSTAGPGDGHEGWWIFRILWFVVWAGVIVMAIWFFAGRRRRWYRDHGAGRASDILAERFARGELSNEEYTERLRQLRAAERADKEN